MSYSEIINPHLNVHNKIRDYEGNWVEQRKPREIMRMAGANRIDITADSEVTVFEVWDKKIIIDSLNYGTSSQNVFPAILIRKDYTSILADSILHVPRASGGRASPVPVRLRNDGSEFLELYYDEAPSYSVVLKEPIILPQGGKLVFSSLGTSAGTETTYKVVWREIDE